MLFLVFVSVVINYMDRTNISVAAPVLSSELSLSPVQMGVIFSAFGWTYSFLQIPGGIAVDMVKVRVLYPFILTAWSIATLLQGFVSSLAALIGCRMAIGVFEAPSFPCNNKIVTGWFPENERASAIAVYTSGQFIGLALLMPLLVLVQAYLGWRGLFIVSGLLGIVLAAVWSVVYRDPHQQRRSTPAHAESSQGGRDREHDDMHYDRLRKLTGADFIAIFSEKKLWGIYIGKFCLGGTLVFFLTWFPTYLVEYRGLGIVEMGFLGAVPFLAAFLGVLVSGLASDYLVRRGVSTEFARKAPIVLGMLLTSCIVGTNYTDNRFLIITFLSIAFFGNGLASIAWVFVSLLAPTRLIGLVGGCFNFISGLSAVIVPIVIGLLVEGGEFSFALAFVAGLAVIGSCSFVFLVGEIRRIERD